VKRPQLQKTAALDWAVWFKWIIATTLGWLLSAALFPAIPFIAAGLTLGILQWLVLVGHIHRPWRWIIASAAGWIVGGTLATLAAPGDPGLLLGLLAGLAAGVAEWLILRQELMWAGWWIPISALAWATGLGMFPGLFSTGALAGAISGMALILLLPHPKTAPLVEES
jgi:hypothetical protein